MRYVVEVAAAGSFTRAAAQLHVAQQALSQQVKLVEEQLGVELLTRSSRGVEPTAAGRVFVQEAGRTLAAADRVVLRTAAAARGETGTLRVGYTLATVYETLPATLEALADEHPQLRVELSEVLAVETEARLLDGHQDVVLCPRTTLGPRCVRHPVRSEALVAALSDAHPLALRSRLGLAELRGEVLELWPRELSPGFYDTVLGACRGAGLDPEIDHQATGSTVWGAIARGHGFGLVVASLREQLPRGVALVALEDDVALSIDAVLAKDCDVPGVRRLVAAASRVGEQRGWLPGPRPR